MRVTFKLSPSQEKRAMEVKERVSQEVQTERTQDWCGNLLGWVSNNETVMLTLHKGEMVLTGTREDVQVALPTVMDVLNVTRLDTIAPIIGGREVVDVGGLLVDVEWYKSWEMIISGLNTDELTTTNFIKLAKQFGKTRSQPNLWIMVHLMKVLEKWPRPPNLGTPEYLQAAADGSLSARHMNELLRNKFTDKVKDMSEGVSFDALTSWYVARAEFLGCGFIN